MGKKIVWLIPVGVVLWSLPGSTAVADIYTWAGGTAHWDEGSSWLPAGSPPAPGDSIMNAATGDTRMNVRSDMTSTISLMDMDFSVMDGGGAIYNNSGGGHIDFISSGTLTKGTTNTLSIRGHAGGTMGLSFNHITMTGGVINFGSAAQANFMATALDVSGTANLSGTRFAVDTADHVAATFHSVILGGGIELRLSNASGGATRDRTINQLSGERGTRIVGSTVNDPGHTNITTLTLNPASGTFTYAGALQDGGGTGRKILHIVKTGEGAQVFSGDDNTYSGTTTVHAGNLIVHATHRGEGLVTVHAGGAIGGDGWLLGGLDLQAGANLVFNPGATLTVTGVTTLDKNFRIANLRVADWAATDFGTYDLLATRDDHSGAIDNWGWANRATGLPGGREAFFTHAGDGRDGLAVTIIPETVSGGEIAPVFHGDILMRSLRMWPRNQSDERDTLATAVAFHADRIVWIYENTPEFNAQVQDAGMEIGTTMQQNAREKWIGNLSGPEIEAFVSQFTIKNLDGEQVISEHKIEFGDGHMVTHFEPDQSIPDWLDYYTDYVAGLYELGIDTLHRDDPLSTWRATRSGGTFTDSAVDFFRTYLMDHFTEEALGDLGVADPGTFNVRDHFKALGAPTDDALWAWRGSPLMPVFQDALMEVDRKFFVTLRHVVEARTGFSIPWSLNGIGPARPHEEAFDFRIGEFQSHFNQPQTILLLNEYARRAGRMQGFVSMVERNWETLASFVPDLRRHIASAYASGAIPLVPWCMYMHDAPRYYGTLEEYGDLYHFVSGHRQYFDGHELLSVSGIDTRSQLYSWDPNKEFRYRYGVPSKRVWLNRPNMMGYVRRAPVGAHVVVHLVDWNEEPEPFEITFAPHALVGTPAADLQVLRPGAEPLLITAYQGQR